MYNKNRKKMSFCTIKGVESYYFLLTQHYLSRVNTYDYAFLSRDGTICFKCDKLSISYSLLQLLKRGIFCGSILYIICHHCTDFIGLGSDNWDNHIIRDERRSGFTKSILSRMAPRIKCLFSSICWKLCNQDIF